jgi:hypothetical protein
MLYFLDIFFFVFHTGLIVFNMVGWIWRRTRPWQLLTLTLTGLSWFALGYWYGWGYCLCTDWHLQVRHQLGWYDDNNSYLYLLIHKLTGLELSLPVLQTLALSVFLAALVLSVTFNVRDLLAARKKRRSAPVPHQGSSAPS